VWTAETFNTVVITAGSVVTGVLSLLGIVLGVRRSRRKRAAEVDNEEIVAVEKYKNDPGQFVHDVLESNASLAFEVRELRKEVKELNSKVEGERKEHGRKMAAVARWIYDIMLTFQEHAIEMPYPVGSDAELLHDVIPAALEATRPRRSRGSANNITKEPNPS
jgi:hypothetical protein